MDDDVEVKNPVDRLVEPSAARAVEVIRAVAEGVGIEMAAQLVQPNVVLTLAGARGQTEFLIVHPNSADADRVDASNSVLAAFGIRLRNDGMGELALSGNPYLGVEVESLDGYERVSRLTTVPGIEPFEAATGWEGLEAWLAETRVKLDKAKQEGRIAAEVDVWHLLTGVIKGYPDSAILGFLPLAEMEGAVQEIVYSSIPYSTQYLCPEPNYGYPKALADDLDILTHQQAWGKILAEFYLSSWHQSMLADSGFLDARAEIDLRDK